MQLITTGLSATTGCLFTSYRVVPCESLVELKLACLVPLSQHCHQLTSFSRHHHQPAPPSTNTSINRHLHQQTPPSTSTSINQHLHQLTPSSTGTSINGHLRQPAPSSNGTSINRHLHQSTIYNNIQQYHWQK